MRRSIDGRVEDVYFPRAEPHEVEIRWYNLRDRMKGTRRYLVTDDQIVKDARGRALVIGQPLLLSEFLPPEPMDERDVDVAEALSQMGEATLEEAYDGRCVEDWRS